MKLYVFVCATYVSMQSIGQKVLWNVESTRNQVEHLARIVVRLIIARKVCVMPARVTYMYLHGYYVIAPRIIYDYLYFGQCV